MRVNLKRVIDLYQRARRTSYMSWYRNQYVKHKDFGKSILIESTHGSDFYGHMFYMTRELSRQFPEMKLYVALTKDKMPSVRTQLSEEGLTNVTVVEFLSKTYCRLLASCHYLLNDTSFYPFFIKQPFQKYINIWHGTPLKCLGKDNGDARNLGNVQKNFFSSDVLLVSNSYTRQAMIQSFNLDRIMRGKVVVGPSPRNSILMDDHQRKLMRDKYDLHDKEAFVYMPTWRGGVSKVQNKTGEIESYLVRLDRSLSDNQVLFVKLHPFQEKLEQIDFSPYKHIRKFPSDVESYAFLSGTDGLITDYSSIMYDYMNTGKPIALFVYDKEDYYSSRGCYEDIDDYPFPKFSDIDQLCDWISQKSHTSSYDDEFKNKYTELDNVEGAAQIAKYIMSGDSANCGAALDELCPYNGKPTVIIYAGTLWENGITAALFNTLNTIPQFTIQVQHPDD